LTGFYGGDPESVRPVPGRSSSWAAWPRPAWPWRRAPTATGALREMPVSRGPGGRRRPPAASGGLSP